MADGMKRGVKRGVKRGMKQGIRKSMEVLIPDGIENGFGKEAIIAKLVKRFEVSRARAEDCYKEVAGSALTK